MEAAGREIFLLLRTISNFTYEMVKKPGEIATDGNFRKRRTRMSFVSIPSALRPLSHFISEI